MTTRPDLPPGARHLVRPDGSVLVPAELVPDVLRTLVLGTTARVRANGGTLAVGAHQLLFALQLAAEQPTGSAPGTPAEQTAMVELTARQAGQLMGCSTEYMRRLARTGRIRARRAGPAWLIDADSLNAYRKGHDMPPEQETQRPGLSAAVGAAFAEQPKPQQAEADAFSARIEADAALYGTPAWDALSAGRRAIVAHRALTTARTSAEQE
ncbi:helix-turn-helix domain-containing protein [Streptomyces sp. ISL-1]|uniref:helix-turn-helix domain-containing protein n=1 Tax=Streptomyces sp. ISL-1 TaxID=2817657 RepID=UPI001BE72CB7|nr:helix-turn-helix domain-containing protein [Streptomyces sp. ISL-1]MBT2391642.1 helix-turn-helix domain-containing protein [Streptomyces sp. ISL-1]